MVHIAITNYKDDEQVTWLEAVTEDAVAETNKVPPGDGLTLSRMLP
ncbi:hypothetical protein GCM10027051_33180 [Niabella terrae]